MPKSPTTSGPRRRRRSLTEDERVLWSAVTRAVAPLKPAIIPPAVGRAEQVTSREAEPAPALPAAAPPGIARPATRKAAPVELDRRFRQRLARGGEPIDARVDLHGLTLAEAHDLLARFLRAASAQGARVVLVITGKGGPAGPESERGALRRQVPLWLKAPVLRDLVIGFAAAHGSHGGEGALYVRLRRRQ
jgi:DNA-nicking Smr family endonuclease